MKDFIKGAVVLIALAVIAAPCVMAEGLKYDSHGRRDPFVPLVGQERSSTIKLKDATSIEDIVLEGIAMKGRGKRAAILNGEVLVKNEKVGDVYVKEISEKAVTILISGKTFSISLPEDGGGKRE